MRADASAGKTGIGMAIVRVAFEAAMKLDITDISDAAGVILPSGLLAHGCRSPSVRCSAAGKACLGQSIVRRGGPTPARSGHDALSGMIVGATIPGDAARTEYRAKVRDPLEFSPGRWRIRASAWIARRSRVRHGRVRSLRSNLHWRVAASGACADTTGWCRHRCPNTSRRSAPATPTPIRPLRQPDAPPACIR